MKLGGSTNIKRFKALVRELKKAYNDGPNKKGNIRDTNMGQPASLIQENRGACRT